MTSHYWFSVLTLSLLLHASNATKDEHQHQESKYHLDESYKLTRLIRSNDEDVSSKISIDADNNDSPPKSYSRRYNPDFDEVMSPILKFCGDFQKMLHETKVYPAAIREERDGQGKSVKEMLWSNYYSHIAAMCGRVMISYMRMVYRIILPSSSTDQNGYVVFTRPIGADEETIDGNDNDDNVTPGWHLPEVRLVRVHAEREGSHVRILFDIDHSVPATIARPESFRYARVDINIPSSGIPGKLFRSRVQFIVTGNATCNEHKYEGAAKELYVFIAKPVNGAQTTFTFGTNARLDTCGFYYSRQTSEVEGKKNSLNDMVHGGQKVENQNFRIISRTKKKSSMVPSISGSTSSYNEIVDVQVYLRARMDLRVFSIMYDYESKKQIPNGKSVSVLNGEIRIDDTYPEEKEKLFTLHVLNTTKLKAARKAWDGENQVMADDAQKVDLLENSDFSVTLRVTIMTGSRQLSGDLIFYVGQSRRYPRAIVKSTTMFHTLHINNDPKERQEEAEIPPYFGHRERLRCRSRGPNITKHCVVDCNAYGAGMTGISLKKLGSNITLYHSAANVLGSTANARLDVGPPSTENQGEYKCSVVKGNGSYTFDSVILLYTTGFPEIDHLSADATSLVHYPNGTSVVRCVANGAPPMNMSIDFMDTQNYERERIDNKTQYQRTLQQVAEDRALLTLSLPTIDISKEGNQNHLPVLECMVESDRGHTSYSYQLHSPFTLA